MKMVRAKVEKLLITRPFETSCLEVEHLSVLLAGIKEDRHFGRNSLSDVRTNKLLPKGIEVANLRAITIVSSEELSYVSDKLVFEVLPEDLEANITLSGIENLTKFSPGTFLRFPRNAILYITAENIPCSYPSENMVARGIPKKRPLCLLKKQWVGED